MFLILIFCFVTNIFAFENSTLATTLGSTATLPHSVGGCEPSLLGSKTGQIAWDKCLEYQEVFPCELDPRDTLRRSRCQREPKVEQLIIRDAEAWNHEFPHMVRLATAEDGKDEWITNCAGALISDTFILTTAHCTSIRGKSVKRIVLESNVTHTVEGVIKHPEYQALKAQRNDIALLKLHKPVQLDHFTVPACLPYGDVEIKRGVIAGWDLVFGRNTDQLQWSKVVQVPTSTCINSFTPRMKQHGTGAHQMCFQDLNNSTCLGSGDILQVENRNLYCMYTVVGLGSIAPQSCYFGLGVGVYTEVAGYVPWIEEIVWK